MGRHEPLFSVQIETVILTTHCFSLVVAIADVGTVGNNHSLYVANQDGVGRGGIIVSSLDRGESGFDGENAMGSGCAQTTREEEWEEVSHFVSQ